jgi:hypothetical protein
VLALTVLGIVPLCLVVGFISLRLSGGVRLHWNSRIPLALAVGAALCTPLLVILAWLGVYSSTALGLSGWALAFATLVSSGGGRRGAVRVSVPDLVAIGFAIAFAILAFQWRDDPLGEGRDQQVYAEFGMHLAQQGNVIATAAPLDKSDRTIVEALFNDDRLQRYLGVTPADREGVGLIGNLPLGWPVWLAFAHGLGGQEFMFGFNTVILALAGLLLFSLLRASTGAPIASAATGAFLLLPSTLWASGVTLAEPLACLLWLAIAALAGAGRLRAMPLVAVLIFCASTIRIDMLLLAPTFLFALLSESDRRESDHVWITRAVVALALAVVATTFWYYALHPHYLATQRVYVGVIVGCSVAMVGVWCLPRRMLGMLAGALDGRYLRAAAIVLLAAIFLYGAIVRPSSGSFSLIQNGSGLDGTRDFREDSLRNLAQYVGWPLLLLATSGLFLALWRADARGSFGRRLFVAGGAAFALLYLWFPLVSPDHPWAVRRFVPVVIPAVVASAAYVLCSVGIRWRWWRSILAPAVLVGLAASTLLNYGVGSLTLRENGGADKAITALAAKLPDELVIADLPAAELASTLLIGMGRPVVVADLRRPDHRALVATWMAAKFAIGADAWLLHAPGLSVAGTRSERVHAQTLSSLRIVGSPRAPARKMEQRSLDIVLTRISGLDRDALFRRFGAEPHWGIEEQGFLQPEVTQFGVLRLTNGNARIAISAPEAAAATGVMFDVFLWSPSGKPAQSAILLDGKTIWDGPVQPGVATLRAPIDRVPKTPFTVELRSATFDTRELDPSDLRGKVGLAVLGIRFEKGATPADRDPTMVGFTSRLEADSSELLPPIPRNQESALIIGVTNSGTRPWPALRDHGIDGAVLFGIRWWRAHAPDQLAADNRWPLAFWMDPGDATRIRVPIVPVGLDGKRLAPGKYIVKIGLVREKHAWFYDDGDKLIEREVTVVP